MSAITTEFEAPEGLFAHEAAFFLPPEKEKTFERAMATALLELADEGSLVYDPASKRLVARLREDAAHTPFQLKMATMYPVEKPGFIGMIGAEKLISQRMFERGWADKNGRFTTEGEKIARALTGYRDYLRKALTDRVHFEAVQGRVGRDALFAAGLGVMSLPNIHRAVALRSGMPLQGAFKNLFDFLGGKSERQHAISTGGGRPPAACLVLLLFWIIGAAAFFIWLLIQFR
jgi:hypothetical protein